MLGILELQNGRLRALEEAWDDFLLEAFFCQVWSFSVLLGRLWGVVSWVSGGSRLDAGGRRLGAGAWKLVAGGSGLEAGGWRLEAGGWRLEAGGWGLEIANNTENIYFLVSGPKQDDRPTIG